MKHALKISTLLLLAILTTGCISVTPTWQTDTRWDAPFKPIPLYGNPSLLCVEERVSVKFALSDDGKFILVPDVAGPANAFFCDEFEMKGNR